jgi:hypothetical protein
VQDPDRGKVGRNVIDGNDLGAGIVETTIAELASLPRPTGLEDIRADPPEFQSVRDGVAEITIWRIEAQIMALMAEQLLRGTQGNRRQACPASAACRVWTGAGQVHASWRDDVSAARRGRSGHFFRNPASGIGASSAFVPVGNSTDFGPDHRGRFL